MNTEDLLVKSKYTKNNKIFNADFLLSFLGNMENLSNQIFECFN